MTNIPEWIIRFEQYLIDHELEPFIGFEILEVFKKFKKEGEENETNKIQT